MRKEVKKMASQTEAQAMVSELLSAGPLGRM